MSWIYKILARAEWAAAKAAGRFEGSGVDLRDGFIHFSTAAQAAETARLHFAGKTDLVVLQVDAGRLGEDLKWEPSRGGSLFPHLFRPLEAAEVEAEHEAPLGDDGTPVIGALPA